MTSSFVDPDRKIIEAFASQSAKELGTVSINSEATTGSGATFTITQEDHTLGNILRHVIMKNPAVEFCGYSIPHPSEAKFNIRIQTDGSLSPLEALTKGLDDVIEMSEHVLSEFSSKTSME